ncbi:MAG TPA: TonB family protein [Patescibacteria group bacterium]|nr:TonB family protein [Patescibacteria group bacterium]
MSRTYTEAPEVRLTISWDKFLMRGFVISLIIHAIFLFLLPLYHQEVRTYGTEIKTIPIELINFGDGDGTGANKGNLSQEGKAVKGPKAADPLSDAAITSRTKTPKAPSLTDPNLSNKLTPVKELASDVPTVQPTPNAGPKGIGAENGDPTARGLGESGIGKGRGTGLGDVSWGGGGNRTVINKVVPQYPSGAKPSIVKLRFWVSPEGKVTKVIPILKGDPLVERAAINALYQWKFNALASNTEMQGEIPFNFMLK